MSKVIADITMSLDGYVTGPLADSPHGLAEQSVETGGIHSMFERRRITCRLDGWCWRPEQTLERVMTMRRQSRLRSSLPATDRSAHGRRWAVARGRLRADPGGRPHRRAQLIGGPPTPSARDNLPGRHN
jgi:hypothetical protein